MRVFASIARGGTMLVSQRPVAIVTGASRGIGREVAIALARRGYNIAVAARTFEDGEAQMYGGFDQRVALPGSLAATKREVEVLGVECFRVRMDLTDMASVEAVVPAVMGHWGRIDVLVNNAIYQGGEEVRIVDQSVSDLRHKLEANTVAPFILVKTALPHILQNGNSGGCAIINITSGSARVDPRFPVDKGGWSWPYAGSKAASMKMAGVLKCELQGTGVRAFNVDPGNVQTELMKLKGLDFRAYGDVPAAVPGAVAAWCAAEPAAEAQNGKVLYAPLVARDLCLVKGYQPDPATERSFSYGKAQL